MRSVTQNNADPSKPYMNFVDSTTGEPTQPKELPSADDLCAELEYCTVHFAHHFCDGLAVIAHHHPDKDVAEMAANRHYFIAEELFHWTPEPRETFLLRHRDKKEGYDRRTNDWSDWFISTYDTWLSTVMNRFKAVPVVLAMGTWTPPGKDAVYGPAPTLGKITVLHG